MKDVKYPFVMSRVEDDDGIVEWVASVVDLRGCVVAGDTAEQVLEDLPSAIEDWIAACEHDGEPVPSPTKTKDLMAKFWPPLPAEVRQEHYIIAEGLSSFDTFRYLAKALSIRGNASFHVRLCLNR